METKRSEYISEFATALAVAQGQMKTAREGGKMIYRVYYQRFLGFLRPVETRLKYLHFTHRFVKQVESDSLDRVYSQMQGEVWSPHGEARLLIKSLHLSHTSLSVGDVVQETAGGYWVCNDLGWLLMRSDQFWPNRRTEPQPPLWLATEADPAPPLIERPGAEYGADVL